MKQYLNSMLMAVLMAITVPMLTACGSDDEDENIASGDNGQQRIEMTIEGDTKGWVVMGGFAGYTTNPHENDKTCVLKCNQTEYVFTNEDNSLTVMIGGLVKRTYPVTVTLEGNSILFLNLQVTKNGEYEAKDVNDLTITLKGYKGTRLTNSFNKTYNSAQSAIIGFHADKSDDKFDLEGEMTF